MEKELLALIEALEPRLRDAFLAAIGAMRQRIDFSSLAAALRNGDMEAAVEALNLDRGSFNGYALERQSAFVQAGEVVATGLTQQRKRAMAKRSTPDPSIQGPTVPPDLPQPPTLAAPGGGSITFSFEMTNPRAEARIRTEAAARVTGYVEEQIETARRVIADGFQRGDGPQNIATDIAGRVNPISGRREGGIIGLSDPQVRYVESMRARLLSGDPDEMMKVLGRFGADGKWVEGTGMTRRDRRFDASIKKAIREVAAGKPNPLSRAKIDEMTAKYADRLLARRAEDIARTETAQAVEMARAEAARQALDKAGLPADALTKTWYHSGGVDHAREQHLAMHEKAVQGIDTPFILPDGTAMLHPHDPAGGVKHNVNCRCRGDQDIEWAFGLL